MEIVPEEKQEIVNPEPIVKDKVNETIGIDNWQIYKNEELKFEIRYPKDWTEKKGTYGGQFEPTQPDLFSLFVDVKKGLSSVDNFLKNDVDDNIKDLEERYGKPVYTIVDQKNIEINGYPAIQRKQIFHGALEDEEALITYIEKKEEVGYKIGTLHFNGKLESMHESNIVLYDKILSSFKFLE